ncbi:MAG: DUF6531 domain-containing protein [Solirubrobacterales bacterium]
MRWFVAFALLLLATSTAPLLTASPAEGSEEPPAEELPAPDFSEIELEEAEHAEWLLSPEAESQREASRTAYTSLSVSETGNLLLEAFSEQIKELNADPARVLSELEIEEPLDAYGALIAAGEGESAILESSVPVESELGGEGKAPVDLSLEESGNDFVPQNPLTEVELPGSAQEPIQLQSGLEVELPASDHEAEALGEMNLFYPATATDTDTLLAPIAGGVEVFEQLRSPESPEEFSFDLSLPAGATLQASEAGGAEVLSASQEMIAEVPPPTGVDAQGTEVPVTMSIEGDSLLLEVPHSSSKFAYPLLVDPAFLSDTPTLTSSEWHSQASGNYAFAKGTAANGAPYIAVWARNNENYAANTDGQWLYTAPGETTFIEEATFGSIHFEGCQSQPHGYLALYNPGSKTFTGRGLYQVEGGKGSGSGSSWTAGGGGYGYRDAVMGVGTALKSVKTTCVMEMRIHGVTMKENDPESPTITSVSGIPASGWFDPSKVGAATIVATDPGFGIKNLSIFDGGVTNNFTQQPCTGLFGHRCQRQVSWTIPPPYLEGERTLKITTEDPLGKTAVWTRATKVDTKEPKIELGGQLAFVTEEEGLKGKENEASENQLSLPVYNLAIKAADGNEKGTAGERQSGVKNIEVFLDGAKQEVSWKAQSCTQAQSSCAMEESYQLKLVGLSAGKHKLKAIAEDQVGNKGERKIEFEYIPTTGMKDEYVMQYFPLPDGEGDEEAEEHPKRPELAVNVTNGNLVYRQKDVEVPGPAVDLELERFYNSQLPTEENTEWGDGWTLAQTPELEPEETKEKAPPTRASMVRTSGVLESSVGLPTESGSTQFDKKLGATVTKEPGGGYRVEDQSGETDTSLAFDSTGKVREETTSGYAKIDYSYDEGDLSELAVDDPASFGGVPPEGLTEDLDPPAYLTSFGGTGPGQLSRPGGVATDAEGNVWVADTSHSRIQEFSSSGKFLRQFGAVGSGSGRLSGPRDIAIDSKGNVWVLDTGNQRVEEFSPKGEYLGKFGSSGSGSGQLSSPSGIAIGPGSHLWVADTSNNRIQEFGSAGEFIRAFGTKGSGNGQLIEPKDVAIDSKGNVWVADTGNHRIQEFSSTGGFIAKFGEEGTKEGQFSKPAGIAADGEGNIWVSDLTGDRIQEFSSAGKYLAQFGSPGNDAGQLAEPQGMAFDAKGNLWVADAANNRIQKFAASQFLLKFGGEGSGAGQLSTPRGVAVDSKGNVWVADTGHNRVQEFSSVGGFIRQFGASGSSSGQFSAPRGIAVDPKGNVWVADTGNNRVQEFSSEGKFIASFGSKGSGDGQLSSPRGIAIDGEGHLWVADTSNNRIQEFSSEGKFIAKFGSQGTANGQFSSPQAVAIDSKGHLWATDTSNNRIQEFSSAGAFMAKFGSQGTANGQFSSPVGLGTDAEGNVWVADSGNDRIQEFSSAGEYLGQFGTTGNDAGQLSEPQGIAIDSKGGLWVADTFNDRVQKFAASEFVLKFGGQGSEAGQLDGPIALTTDDEGNVWVADTNHERIQEFNSEGEFIRQFSGKGSGECQLFSPRGIAVDSKGHVWVADSSNERVQEFSAEGACLSPFGKEGSAEGQFGSRSLRDLAIDSEDHIWTVEGGLSWPHRVQEFSPKGEFIRAFGEKGSGDGQFAEPTGIAIDTEGNIWVADTGNHRVQEFSPEGKYLAKFGKEGEEDGQLQSPTDLAFAPDGRIWVIDRAGDRAQAFGPEGEYLAKFGAAGNDDGQLSQPNGISVGTEGKIWIADTGNSRVQGWQIPSYVPKHNSIYLSSFGAEGSAAGQLSHPADVAIDAEGNLWVADEVNNRVEEFNDAGELIETFGKNVNRTAVEAKGSEAARNLCTVASEDTCQAGDAGGANGQLDRPASLAVDAAGDVWVADAGNSRIQKFGSDGKYLAQFGSFGEGNGEFFEPEGVAVDPHGNVWVADTYNGRVQEFDGTGKFIKVVGSYGTGKGQMGEPTGIDIGLGGNVWIADWQDNRVEEFDEEGKFVRQFGAYGKESGQFIHPDGIAVDDKGQVWVADEGNDRVQSFTERGEYVTQFGTSGSGDGQFSFRWPLGIATDSKGKLWIADSENNRMQRWGVYNYVAADEAWVVGSDPKVEIEATNGLVESVEGEQAGKTTYEHKGELLTAVDGPQGGTEYEYDSKGRLTKVTLPNGTWGKVAYGEFDGRVKSVTVDPAGSEPAKTTYFTYQDSPSRRTTVSPESEKATIYDIAADGSVLKWWNTKVPPEIENLSGSLYANKETAEAVEPGDYELLIQAYSAEGIASIEVIANGSIEVDEKTCDQDWKTPERECKTVEDPWVANTGNWAPGILNLEVIVTDANGGAESAKFWVNIPYTPPPDPEADEPPTFDEVLHFREEFGLDLDLNGDELAIDERIFNLIGDWHNPNTLEGEITRATYEQWGVPLRAADAAELEYRDQYVNTDVNLIEEWASANYPTTYSGYYVDHRAGGILHVGFTQSQNTRLVEIKQQLPILAAHRLAVYPTAPTRSQLSLDDASETISEHLESNAELASLVTELEIDETANVVRVGTTDISRVESILTELLGSQAPLEIVYKPKGILVTAGRNRTTGRMRAGDRIISDAEAECTAAFGAFEDRKKKSNGENIRALFVLSAGHCAWPDETIHRVSSNASLKNAKESAEVGVVTRNAVVPGKISTDGLAIRVKASGVIPHGIYGSHDNLVPYGAATKARNSNEVCYSGALSNRVSCGPVVGRVMQILVDPSTGLVFGAGVYRVQFVHPVQSGDSGSPVWNRKTHAAIGVVSARAEGQKVSAVTPLLHPKRLSLNLVPGILHAPGMYSLSLSTTAGN